MASRFLLLVALLFCLVPSGRSQYDLQDPLGSAFRLAAQARLRQQLAPNTCAILFSGGFVAQDPAGRYAQPFECDPDFYYLTGLRIPDAAVVVFAESRTLTEGAVSTLLFLPDKTDYGLVSMGYEYKGKFGMQEGGVALRQAGLWTKFCSEVLATESVTRVFTKPIGGTPFQKPGGVDFWELSHKLFATMAPGFPFEANAQKFYKEILAADSASMGPLAMRINARMEYESPDLRDPILERFGKLTRPAALRQLQDEIRRVKIDLLQFECCLKMGMAQKSPEELQVLQQATAILGEAMKAAAARAVAGRPEYKLSAAAAYVARFRNADLPMPILVAAGKHSALPNYAAQNGSIPKSGPVVVDIAVGVDGYVARATRTLPAGGSFGTEVKALYLGVAAIHQKTIDACLPNTSPSKLQATAAAGFEALDKVQIFASNALGARKVLKVTNIYPTGLAIDEGPAPKALLVGSVICVETALYLPDEESTTSKWRGTGIVLRDMLRIGADGPEVLTRNIPTDITSLESWTISPNRLPED